LTLLGGLITSLFICKGTASYFVQRTITTFSWHMQLRLRARLMSVYQSMPYTFHLTRNSATLLNVLENHILQFSKGVVGPSLRLVWECVTIVAIMIFLTFTFPGPTTAIILVLVVFFVLYDRLMRRPLSGAGHTASEARADVIRAIRQAIGGLKEIRVLGAEPYFHGKVVTSARLVADANIQYATLQLLPRYVIEAMTVSLVIGLALVLLWIEGGHAPVFATLGVFAAAGLRILPSANQIVMALAHLRYSHPFVERIYLDLHGAEQAVPAPDKTAVQQPLVSSAPRFQRLTFDTVSYRYPSSPKKVVDSISFSLERGCSLAIIGPSGAGKTTLVDLLLGLLTPSEGRILTNDRPVHADLAAWQRQTAYIPQTTLLLDDSLRRNVALGVEDGQIDDKKLTQALALAQLTQVVDDLPEGAGTVLGEQGIRLSGGQRQRVALARAFYHDRDLIVMDEATSALDIDTEHDIIQAIDTLKGRKTLVVIAHRLSLVRHCDHVIRLDAGRIAAYGSYEEVVERTTSFEQAQSLA